MGVRLCVCGRSSKVFLCFTTKTLNLLLQKPQVCQRNTQFFFPLFFLGLKTQPDHWTKRIVGIRLTP